MKGTKGNWEKRVLGTWVLGFWGFIKRGESYDALLVDLDWLQRQSDFDFTGKLKIL